MVTGLISGMDIQPVVLFMTHSLQSTVNQQGVACIPCESLQLGIEYFVFNSEKKLNKAGFKP